MSPPYTLAMFFSAHRGRRNVVNLFGFPTTFNVGFLMFLVILIALYPFPLGLWVAGAVAVFTLIHELGHALAARACGYRASISLDFMVAYASYEPTARTTWRHKALISVAGPALHVGISLITLAAMGVNPLVRADVTSTDASIAIWWAGFVLGLINLVPLVPLDGGTLVSSIAERIWPAQGKSYVLKASFVITASLTALCLAVGAVAELMVLAFMLVIQYQQIVSPQRMRSLLNRATITPGGDPDIDGMFIDAMIDNEQLPRAREFAIDAYRACPAFRHALAIARIEMRLGHEDSAITWLNVAAQSQLDGNELKNALVANDEFDPIRSRPGVSVEWFSHV